VGRSVRDGDEHVLLHGHVRGGQGLTYHLEALPCGEGVVRLVAHLGAPHHDEEIVRLLQYLPNSVEVAVVERLKSADEEGCSRQRFSLRIR